MPQDNRTDDIGMPRIRAWLLALLFALAAGVVGFVSPVAGGVVGAVGMGGGVAILLRITKTACRSDGIAYAVAGLTVMGLFLGAGG